MIPFPLLRARTCLLLAAAFCAATAAAAQPADTDWTVATGNQSSQRYAPLSQIDASNVDELVEVWRWQSPDVALVEANAKLQSRRMQLGSHEVSPLKIGDRLYVTTGYSQLAAIDAATGETLWVYDPKAYETGRPPNLGFVHRGATYWQDEEGRGRVVYATGNAYLHSVDAFTGEPVGGFGDGGTVDLTQGLRREFSRRGYGVSSPVIACNDTFIVGSSISDGATHPEAPPGDVRGFDAVTGEQLWSFQSVPQEGELGNETWLDGSWKMTGNTNVWTLMSADPELGLVYLPFGTPTNDWYGGHRRGDNLFAESIVAVDCRTGKRRWHFQTTHHGVWDYDLVTSPILGDVEVEGRTVRGLFQLTKQGFVFAFDRATGEPIWPIEERPVPQSDVPGEMTSATQPFPTKPPAYERQGVMVDDLIDFTPELNAEAREILAKYRVGPIYTPPTTDKLTLNLPGWAGGSSWQGGGFDPATGFLYVPSFTLPIGVRLQKPDPSRSGFDWVAELETVVLGPRGLPLLEPPYSKLTAYDMNRGEIAWVEVLGDGPRNHPELAELDLPPLGTIARSHVLVTDTLLFVNSSAGLGRGYSPDVEDARAYLRAFDKATGRLLLETVLDKNTDGSPASYVQGGRQFVVFALGGREEPAELVAYALPATADSP
ncbi:MAG: PQQ-binding-like beta-propeller repeat protein [Acidobacteriota bacterium]